MAPGPMPTTMAALADLVREKRDLKLLWEVEHHIRPVRLAPGRLEFQPTDDAAPDLAARLAGALQRWTGQRWGVSVVATGGGATLAEDADKDRKAAEAAALENPLVQAVMAAFPGARIAEIRSAAELAAEAQAEALPEVEDEWDPFEED
jgi:DNA polymerase-3 subunit gamma/tau